MKTNIRNYMPERVKTPKILVQAPIDKEIVKEVKKIMKKERWTWITLITACLERIIDEEENKNKNTKI